MLDTGSTQMLVTSQVVMVFVFGRRNVHYLIYLTIFCNMEGQRGMKGSLTRLARSSRDVRCRYMDRSFTDGVRY
jgi:hypothetical protein